MTRSRVAGGLFRCLAASVLIGSVADADPAQAASTAIQRGRAFARAHCAGCHAIDKVTDSSLKIAPPFRTLHQRYPIETLSEAFAEGIYTGHAAMPAFQLDPDEISDVLAFLKSLE